MAAKKSTKKSTKTAKGIEVTLVPNENIPPSRIYSNFIQVAQTPYDFSLKFCDATPISGSKNVGGKVTHAIPIVAEIAIPFNLMSGFIKALQTQYEVYKDKIEWEGKAKKSSKK